MSENHIQPAGEIVTTGNLYIKQCRVPLISATARHGGYTTRPTDSVNLSVRVTYGPR